ncbi:MAG: Eco57I restriction-modification methylase domain-containing protein [Paludibacteraceae bacterium]|nr:Eco57I restriction-modification methylase domain-containing protein [Paludibacteraceae bacterium]MBN2787598.1 Eco57I restriction-modification methylase domain-containing protein [Paludibacteraceae bacterium]
MSFFQNAVLTKYINHLNKETVSAAYSTFKAHFHNATIQENIRTSKEEEYQEGFLRDLFVGVLGYTLNPAPNFNLKREKKNESNSKKADGAIEINEKVLGVIELKGTDTTDLSKVETQAFGYKNNQKDCVYVITSNFEKLRFYIDNAIEHLEFNLFTLTEKEFEILYLCLAFENIEKGLAKKIKDESVSQEDKITKELYKDYSVFKRELYQDLVAKNPQYPSLELFKKSQKLLDRFLFLFFAEDRQLLPPNSIRLILEQWKKLCDLDEYTSLYNRFKKYFGYLNTGYKGKQYDVFAYNGGLFKPDEVLDNVQIDDELLYKHTLKLSGYDFASEVDVNILGHIFENSLNEIDEVKAEIEGQVIDKTKTKRKKDGVFYTPKYITKYIVDNTIGKLCTEKKAELEINEADYTTDKKRQLNTKKALLDKLNLYRDWLLQLTICDPACGSGAFLNQALDFLITEHKYLDELQAKLMGASLILSDIENSILENNLFGVDLNEESVEIAKLSLWLRTAQPNRKLNDLNNNIKCGNSLIDDPAVAGDKAFNWQTEFPGIFTEKKKTAWHVTTASHNSRYSQRMFDNHVKLGEKVWFDETDEHIILQTIADITKEDKLNIPAVNICGDHLHLLLVCEEEELTRIVQKIKSKTARAKNKGASSLVASDAGGSPYRNKGASSLVESDTVGSPSTNKGASSLVSSTPVDSVPVDSALPDGTPLDRVSPDTASLDAPSTYPISENDASDTSYSPLDDSITIVCEPVGAYDTPRGTAQTQVWTQKFGKKQITSEEQLHNTLHYIRNNRVKHNLKAFGKKTAALIEDIECSTEHAFRAEYKGGFDVVIGNPPYVGISSQREIHDYLKSNYAEIHTGYNDLMYYFMYKGITLLNTSGVYGVITSNYFIGNDYADKLRVFLNKHIEVLVNFEKTLIFSDANVHTTLVFAKKRTIIPTIKFHIYKQNKPLSIVDISNGYLTCELERNKLSEKWLIADSDNQSIIDKLHIDSSLLGEICIIEQGSKSGKNDIFTVSYEFAQANLLEKDILRKNVKNGDIDRYSFLERGYYLIYIDNQTKIEDYANVLNYLKKYRNELSSRNEAVKGLYSWFRLDRPRNKSVFDSNEKIIVPYRANRNRFAYDDKQFFNDGGDIRAIVLNGKEDISIKYILTLLNSKILDWFYGFIGKEKGDSREYFNKPLSEIPIKKISLFAQQPFIEKADLMLSLNKSLQESSQKFQRTLERKFELADLSTKLQNWYTLSYKEFIAELGKKKVKLSLAQEAEWEEYFLQEQTKALALKQQIDITDKEIDHCLVLKYGYRLLIYL